MKNKLNILTYSLVILITATSCTEKNKEQTTSENKIQQSVNPNGDSELAILMREMFDEAESIKQQITNGRPVKLNIDHEKMLTAHATEPEKTASGQYKVFADLYLQSIKNLESAKAKQMDSLYNTMVVSCLNCHKALCPGPLVRIKKLQRL